MLKRRPENILTYLRHRVTNAAGEFIHSRIRCVKYTARGFRNKSHFQTAIYSTAAAWMGCRHAKKKPEEPTLR
jgi:transposase